MTRSTLVLMALVSACGPAAKLGTPRERVVATTTREAHEEARTASNAADETTEPADASGCEAIFSETHQRSAAQLTTFVPPHDRFVTACEATPELWRRCMRALHAPADSFGGYEAFRTTCRPAFDDPDRCVDPVADAFATEEGDEPYLHAVDLDGDGSDDYMSTSSCRGAHDYCYSRVYVTDPAASDQGDGASTCTRYAGTLTAIDGRLPTQHHGLFDLVSCSSLDCAEDATVYEYDGRLYREARRFGRRTRPMVLRADEPELAYTCEDALHWLEIIRAHVGAAALPDRSGALAFCEALAPELQRCMEPGVHEDICGEPPPIAGPIELVVLVTEFQRSADRVQDVDIDGDGDEDDAIVWTGADLRGGVGVYRHDDAGRWQFLGSAGAGPAGVVVESTKSHGIYDLRSDGVAAACADPQLVQSGRVLESGARFDGTHYASVVRACSCATPSTCDAWRPM